MSLLPQTLYETESPISGKIRVIQVGLERRLVVGGLVQSINFDASEVDERIWGQLTNIKDQKAKIKNALILGLGGGTVAHLSTQKFGPIPIDAVELDPVIVEVGKRFFGLDQIPNLNIIIKEASELVNKQPNNLTIQPYDLIVVDLYCSDEYPSAAESKEFFAGLKRLLNRHGLIIINRISTEKDLEFEEKLGKSFGNFEKKSVPSKFGGRNIIYEISA